MMKLRTKMFTSDTSKFRLLMSKALSVYVFAVKERLTAETLSSLNLEEQFSVAQVRDCMMIWLGSFESNTTQDGYEIVCVQEASFRLLKALRPHIAQVDFPSDAVRGYKLTQSILALRGAAFQPFRGRKA
jgi:hypothetical protein